MVTFSTVPTAKSNKELFDCYWFLVSRIFSRIPPTRFYWEHYDGPDQPYGGSRELRGHANTFMLLNDAVELAEKLGIAVDLDYHFRNGERFWGRALIVKRKILIAPARPDPIKFRKQILLPPRVLRPHITIHEISHIEFDHGGHRKTRDKVEEFEADMTASLWCQAKGFTTDRSIDYLSWSRHFRKRKSLLEVAKKSQDRVLEMAERLVKV